MVFGEGERFLISYPFGSEDCTGGDGVVHHLFFPSAVSYECAVCFGFLPRPFIRPDGVAVGGDCFDDGDEYAFGSGDISEDGSFGDKVSDHDEASASYIECAEESFFDPVGHFADAPFVAAEFIVVEVVDNDIVGSCFAVSESARRLSASASEELYTGGGFELSFRPRGVAFLESVVGDEALVVFEFGLNIAQEPDRAVFGFADDNHK